MSREIGKDSSDRHAARTLILDMQIRNEIRDVGQSRIRVGGLTCQGGKVLEIGGHVRRMQVSDFRDLDRVQIQFELEGETGMKPAMPVHLVVSRAPVGPSPFAVPWESDRRLVIQSVGDVLVEDPSGECGVSRARSSGMQASVGVFDDRHFGQSLRSLVRLCRLCRRGLTILVGGPGFCLNRMSEGRR